MDTGDCQPLYHAIRDFYEGLNMKIDQQIPMLLVERHALNEAIVGEKGVSDTFLYVYAIFRFFCFVLWKPSDRRHGSFQGIHHMPETRGLCLSEEQTVTSVRFVIMKVISNDS